MIAPAHQRATSDADEIARLTDDLHRTYDELRALVDADTDAVIHLPTGSAYMFPETQRELSRMETVERKHAAERAAILNAMPAQIAILDGNGKVVAINQSWPKANLHIDGPEAKTILGMDYLRLCRTVAGLGRADAVLVAKGLASISSGRSDLFTMKYRCGAPTFPRWFQLTLSPLGSECPRGAVVMHMDISEHLRADAREAELQGRIERLVDQAPVGIIVHRNFVPILANKELARLFGYAGPNDILSLADCRDLFEQPDREILAHHAAARLGGKTAPSLYQVTARHQDGRWITLEIRAFPIRWGKELALCAMITDITAKLQVEEQLRSSQRLEALGQLTGGIAHDFNNLLTVILGNADLLIDALADSDLLELAEVTASMAERGASLTKRLLAFARLQPLEPQIVDINRQLDAMDDLLRRALGGQIDIQMFRSPSLWPALIDPGELENAILNLCINARDAMVGGGQRLTIETANVQLDASIAPEAAEGAAGEYVMIAVSDDGSGMDAETIKRVFEPFFTTKSVGSGSGLGLSRVYGFVKQSKGRIQIYSEQDHGTSIKLYFPRAPGDPQAATDGAADPATVTRPVGLVRILAVEDDEGVRRLVNEQLVSLGYEVVAVESAAAALELLQGDTAFDLLFTDIIMPGGMNGRELADEVAGYLPGLPILFTSGYSASAIIHHGQLEPGVLLLQKPYRRQELASMLRVALDSVKV